MSCFFFSMMARFGSVIVKMHFSVTRFGQISLDFFTAKVAGFFRSDQYLALI